MRKGLSYMLFLSSLLVACQSGEEQNGKNKEAVETTAAFTDDTVHVNAVKPDRKSATEVPDSTQTAPSNNDWVGTYQGVLPCADCEGIATELILGSYGTYKITETYQGKQAEPFSTQGSIKWIKNGTALELTAGGRMGQQYLLGDHMLYHLDKGGKIIKGKLSRKYILKKI